MRTLMLLLLFFVVLLAIASQSPLLSDPFDCIEDERCSYFDDVEERVLNVKVIRT